MKHIRRYLPWDSSSAAQPIDILRLVTLVLAGVAILVGIFAPIGQEMHIRVIGITLAGLAYAALVSAPIFPEKRALVDAAPFWIPIGDVFFISLVVMLFYNDSPVIAVLYLLGITGVAIRHGLLISLWTALLSTLGYLIVLTMLGILATEFKDAIVLITTFLAIGLFAGSLAHAAQRRNREFENVVTRSRDGIFIFNDQGKIEFLNPAMLALSGYSSAEIVGRSFFDFITDSVDLANMQTLWSLISNHPVPDRPFVVHIQVKDGTPRILSVTLSRLNPNPARYMAVARDITLQEFERIAHERRDRELEAERQVAFAVSTSLDLNQVLELALDQALAALQADAGIIYLADDAQSQLTLAVSRKLPDELVRQVQHYRFGEGITGRCAEQKQALIVSNTSEEPIARQVLQDMGIMSQISVPLLIKDCVVGVLNLNKLGVHQFTESDAALLRAIASSVAVAVDHARLFESLEERIQVSTAELVALNRIAQAGNQSLNLDAVLNATLNELTQTLKVPGGWIALLDHDTNVLNARAQVGIPDYAIHKMRPQSLGEGLGGDIVMKGQARALNIEGADLRSRDSLWDYGIRSLCAVPLIAAGYTVGVLGLASDQKDRFGESELRWLTTVGNTIAFAVRNAQLYTSVEQQVVQLATLREIDRTLNSTLDLEPMLEIMLTSIAQVVPHDRAVVYLLEGTWMRGVAARGIKPGELSAFKFETTGDLAFDEMARSRKPITIGELNPSALHWSIVPNIEEIHSWLGTPLIARDAIIGQISLYSAERNTFTSVQADWMLAFSNHAAITIANALLRAELRRQASFDSLTQVLNHGRFIEELRDACKDAQAHNEPISLIMLDLDNFKSYNTTYGHVVGDTVLSATVQAIRAHIHQSDLVGRWGGEEFGVALCGANTQRAMQIAERIQKTLATTIIHNRHGDLIPPPTVSQGIASIGGIVRDMDDLIEYADRALYFAKNQGRDQVTCANDLRWVTR